MNITINNRQHSLRIVPIVSPDAPDSPIGIEARGDGKPQKLCIRAGMTPLETATAAAHLVSTLWLMKAGKPGDVYPRPGQIKVGRTRYRLRGGSDGSDYAVDQLHHIIRVEPGNALQVARRAAEACNLAWEIEPNRRKGINPNTHRESPAYIPKRTLRLLVGRESYIVRPVQPRYVPKGFGSQVIRKKRRINLAVGDGYAPFAALVKAVGYIEERSLAKA